MKHLARTLKRLIGAAVVLSLAACGGGEVGGTVTGLGTSLSVTLLNNGSDSLTINRNGSFFFVDRLDANAAYSVTVRTQPVGQTCNVTNGSGTLDAEGTTVDNVLVSCSFSSSLRGTASGLRPGVAVTLISGSNQLVVSADGPFAFTEVLADGTAYSVRVLTQPSGLTCTVQNDTGTFFARSFQDIFVVCS
jgi:hypothetical protein